MLNSQSTKLSILPRLNEVNPLFQSVLEISDEAVFIIGKSKNDVIDCNSAAVRLFEASSKEDLLNIPLYRLYNSEPLELSQDNLAKELAKNGYYSHELSFKTCKKNIFWGKLVRKNISFENFNYSVLKITKSANFLREEEWLGEVLKVTSKATGRQYFKEVTKFLCKTFDAQYAFIARRIVNDDTRLKIFYWHGDTIKNHYISIKNSFVENTLKGYTSYYPTGLSNLFPNDKIIKATSANSYMGTPIFDASEEVFGIMGVLNSDSMEELPNSRYMLSILSSRAASEIQRIRSKELLRQQTRELAEINLMKDKLISVVSSDLQAPLNTILGYSDMLKNKSQNYTSEELVQKMTLMDRTLRNLYVFLENLADWNSLQQNEIRCKAKNDNLVKIIEDTKPYFTYLSDLKKVNIQYKVPSNICVFADSYLIRAAVRNVATYLIKNTMKKDKVIFDSIIMESKNYLVIKSENFSADPEDVVFCLEAKPQELYNASKDTSVPVLGLFIAREFMKLQGGSLNYKYNDTVFELWFEFGKESTSA